MYFFLPVLCRILLYSLGTYHLTMKKKKEKKRWQHSSYSNIIEICIDTMAEASKSGVGGGLGMGNHKEVFPELMLS